MDLERFKNYLLDKDLRITTIKRHLSNLKRLERDIGVIEFDSFDKFIHELKEKGISNAHRRSYVCLVRRLADCFELDERLRKYPIPKKESRLKAVMSDEEIETFLNLPAKVVKQRHRTGKWMNRVVNYKLDEMMKCFWRVCADSGMRMGEVAHLRVQDVDFGNRLFILHQTKTNEPRYVAISPTVDEAVKTRIELVKTGYLFPSSRGGLDKCGHACIDNVDWHYDFKDRLKRMGLVRPNLTPYSIRHSFGTRLAEEDCNLGKIMQAMGHNDIKTTLQYVHLDTKSLHRTLRQLPRIRNQANPWYKVRKVLATIDQERIKEDNRISLNISETDTDVYIHLHVKHSFDKKQ